MPSEKTGLTQRQLSYILGIPPYTLNRYLRNRRMPDPSVMTLLIAAENLFESLEKKLENQEPVLYPPTQAEYDTLCENLARLKDERALATRKGKSPRELDVQARLRLGWLEAWGTTTLHPAAPWSENYRMGAQMRTELSLRPTFEDLMARIDDEVGLLRIRLYEEKKAEWMRLMEPKA